VKSYQKLIYFLISLVLCLYVLAIFIRTTPFHLGINQFAECKFVDMIEGKANRPYVSRALVPIVVNNIAKLTPQSVKTTFSNYSIENNRVNSILEKLGWEKEYFYEYIVALSIMLFCFMGIAYVGPQFLQITCGIANTFFNKIILLALSLLILPAFFRYASYIYDPSQIFLFITCLYFLAVKKLKIFTFVFFFLCINKETSILLIPIFAVAFYENLKKKEYITYLLLLCFIYIMVRISIAIAFMKNSGSFLEFHLFDHNRIILPMGWTFADVFLMILFLILLTYMWKAKPFFLKTSFLGTFIPLVVMAMFFGFIDELRGYYEAYFPALGLSIDSFIRI
jgi:hypothetical protein